MTVDKTKGYKAYFVNDIGEGILIAEDLTWKSKKFPNISKVNLLTDFVGYFDTVKVCSKAFNIPVDPK
jgi:hypothetical protein